MNDEAFEALCKLVGMYGGAIDELIAIIELTAEPVQRHRLRDLRQAVEQSVENIKAESYDK